MYKINLSSLCLIITSKKYDASKRTHYSSNSPKNVSIEKVGESIVCSCRNVYFYHVKVKW